MFYLSLSISNKWNTSNIRVPAINDITTLELFFRGVTRGDYSVTDKNVLYLLKARRRV